MYTNKMPVTDAVVCSKAVALLLLIPCLLLLSLWGFCVCSMFLCSVLCSFQLCNHLDEEERAS